MSVPSELEAAVEAEELAPSPGFRPGARAGGKAASIVGRSPWQIAWRRLKRDRVALVAGAFIILLILVAILANALSALYGQNYQTVHNAGAGSLLDPLTSMPQGSLGGMSATHWLGVTPLLGQDIFSMLLFGARTSLIISGLSTALSLILGITLGLMAGYFRGWTDIVISRIMDVLLSFPTLLFGIALVTVVGFISSAEYVRYGVLIFILGFFGFPYIGRIVRGQVLSLREKEFVDAARSLGASNGRIMFKELAPNLIGPILVYTTLTIPNNIMGEASYSFLGIGVTPPAVSWGGMLSSAGSYFQIDPMFLIWPGLALFLSVLAFNLFGDGLRDALDPKSTR